MNYYIDCFFTIMEDGRIMFGGTTTKSIGHTGDEDFIMPRLIKYVNDYTKGCTNYHLNINIDKKQYDLFKDDKKAMKRFMAGYISSIDWEVEKPLIRAL